MLFNDVNSDVGCPVYSKANNRNMTTRTSAETISKTPGEDAERIKAMLVDSPALGFFSSEITSLAIDTNV